MCVFVCDGKVHETMPPLILPLTELHEPKDNLVEVPHNNDANHNDVWSILKDKHTKLKRY